MDFDSIFAPQQWTAFWTKANAEQRERVATFTAEWTKLEGEAVSRYVHGVEEMAKLGKSSMEHSFALANEWRKMWLDALVTKREAPAAKA